MKSEEYKYELPEGYEFKPETREKIDTLVHRLGLSQEDMQEFINIHVELMEEYATGLESVGNSESATASYAPEETLSSQPRRAKYSSKSN